ncbi:MAG: glycerol kinase [Chloroflexi bacterium]|nr:glycerol kinase [Chloroflexota bacterium]|tara:strand:- start:38310 stop:39788 length:1479 start_codon:yes stop_codon:yes gene_type:complete
MDSEKKYVISIDQGSTSTRSVIYDLNLNLISSSQIKLEEIYPENGWVELEPYKIIESVIKTINNAILDSGINIKNILSIGLTNQRETVVFWDKKTLKPFGNAISWQCLRGIEICEKLKSTEFEKKFIESTGLKIDPYFSFSKIIWAIENNKEINNALKNNRLRIGTIDTWILANLTDSEEHKIEITNASRTGLFNTKTEEWDESLLSLLNLDKSIFPSVHPSDAVFGKTKKKLFGKEIEINAILGDQQSSLYGHKDGNQYEIKCTFGTGGFLLIDTGEKRFSYNNNFLSTIAFKKNEKTMHALEGSILSAGSTLEWLKKINVIENFEDIENQLNSTQLNDVQLIPALNGLGAPFWDGKIRASIENINSGTTKEEIIRSAFESIGFSTKAILEKIEETISFPVKVLKIDGGLSKSPFFCQFLSDLLNIKVKASINSEITSMGVAKLAIEKFNIDYKFKIPYSEFDPISNNKNVYTNKYKKWKKLIENKIKVKE